MFAPRTSAWRTTCRPRRWSILACRFLSAFCVHSRVCWQVRSLQRRLAAEDATVRLADLESQENDMMALEDQYSAAAWSKHDVVRYVRERLTQQFGDTTVEREFRMRRALVDQIREMESKMRDKRIANYDQCVRLDCIASDASRVHVCVCVCVCVCARARACMRVPAVFVVAPHTAALRQQQRHPDQLCRRVPHRTRARVGAGSGRSI